jgi:hypothetical protein
MPSGVFPSQARLSSINLTSRSTQRLPNWARPGDHDGDTSAGSDADLSVDWDGMGIWSYRVPMSVRQKIDELISDSIDEFESHTREASEPDSQMPPTDFTLEIQELAAQVHELTAQVATLTTIIRNLRQE